MFKTKPKLDPESYEQIYPRLEPYNDPSAAPDMNVNFGGLKFAPSYQNINVPELLENVPEYLALVEGPEDETRRPRPRGRYDGGRSQKRTEQRQKTLLYQRHPEKLEELADEAMKNQYKLFLQEREARLKWFYYNYHNNDFSSFFQAEHSHYHEAELLHVFIDFPYAGSLCLGNYLQQTI